MTAVAPVEHLQDAQKLTADSDIDLWEVRLKGISTIVRFWNGPTTSWGGKTFEGLACKLQGEGKSAQDQDYRPVLTVINPDKVFGVFAAEGYLDLASVIRYRVLQQHFLNNINIYQQRSWIIGQVVAVTSQSLQVQLRSFHDMPAWQTPRRSYTPPDYPFVVL